MDITMSQQEPVDKKQVQKNSYAYDQEQQIKHELEEYRRKRRESDKVIRRVILLGQKLGHEPDLFDLYIHQFTNAEIDWLNDILYWLSGDNGDPIPSTSTSMNGNNSELCDIIQLHCKSSAEDLHSNKGVNSS